MRSKVSDVHADLGAAVGEDANGLDAVKTAVGGANVAGDGARGGDVGSVEVDVVGDEEAAGTDGAGTGGLVKFGAADIGAAGSVAAGGIAEAFELALADVFELDAVGTGGGGSVEVDGNAVAAPDEQACLAGEHGALGEGGPADGDEGDDVGGADAGVNAVLLGEVDQFGGFACGADGRFDDCRRRAGDRDDGAIVRGIERPVEQADTSTCMAATIWLTLAASVPSEKFGTHSMIASGFIRARTGVQGLVYERFTSTRCIRARIVRWR